MRVRIEYCTQWNYRPQADGLSAELKSAFSGSDVELELVEAGGGVFEVDIDGQRVFSKQKLGRFPEYQEVPRLALEVD